MIILGIDPGVAIVGFGVIEYSGSKFRTLDYGVIRTPAHTDTEKRLATIYSELKGIIEKYHPDYERKHHRRLNDRPDYAVWPMLHSFGHQLQHEKIQKA